MRIPVCRPVCTGFSCDQRGKDVFLGLDRVCRGKRLYKDHRKDDSYYFLFSLHQATTHKRTMRFITNRSSTLSAVLLIIIFFIVAFFSKSCDNYSTNAASDSTIKRSPD